MSGREKGSCMNLEERRRQRLRALIEQWEGSPTRLARDLHLSGPSYLSQLLGGTRPFSEKTARKFERTLGLDAGYFDGSGEATPTPVNGELGLTAEITEALLDAARELRVEIPRAKIGGLVALIHRQAKETGTVDREYVKMLARLASR